MKLIFKTKRKPFHCRKPRVTLCSKTLASRILQNDQIRQSTFKDKIQTLWNDLNQTKSSISFRLEQSLDHRRLSSRNLRHLKILAFMRNQVKSLHSSVRVVLGNQRS